MVMSARSSPGNPKTRVSRLALAGKCLVSVRFRVDFGTRCSVGPGKVELLETIHCAGSLSQAARTLGLSYRRAWQLVEDLNRSFSHAVVAASRGGPGGGGASVSPFGMRLIRRYRRFEGDIQRQAARTFALFGESPRGADPCGSRRGRRGSVRGRLAGRRP